MDNIVLCILLLPALWFIAGISGIIQYAKINKSVVLVCQQEEGATNVRWRRNNSILTDDLEINSKERRHKAFNIDFDKDARQYKLRIANVTVDDFGVYLCEMQINNAPLNHQITLSNEGKQIIISEEVVTNIEHVKHTETYVTTMTRMNITGRITGSSDEIVNSGLLTLIFIGISCLSFGSIICMALIKRKRVMPSKIAEQHQQMI